MSLYRSTKARGGEEVSVEGGGVRDGDAAEGDAGEELDVHLLEADLGPHLAGHLGPHLLLELGGVERADEVGGVAADGQDHHDDEGDDSDQDLLHGAPMMPASARSGNGGSGSVHGQAPPDARPGDLHFDLALVPSWGR